MKYLFILYLLFRISCLEENKFEKVNFQYLTSNERMKLLLDSIGAKEDSCLPSKNDTINILKEKYDIVIDIKSVTKNLRFIVGDCSPVVLIPGIFSVKLKAQIDCKGLYYNETDVYQKVKFFCSDYICPNVEDIQEEDLFLKLDGPFGFMKSLNDKNLHNACFSFFMTIFNDDECPLKKNICTKSDYIKVTFDGGTKETYKNSQCGVSAIKDVFLSSDFISKYVGKSEVYGEISELLKSLGYNYGFSLGGIPNDFRKFVVTNKFATNVFRFMIESFYNNTGKQVILIAHSFGNLIALNNLVSKENEDLIPKIKKFVSIGPPFSGSTKLLNGYLHGLTDFNNFFNLVYYHLFGQSLLFKSVPTAIELRPLPIFAELYNNPEYKDFVYSIIERINLEKMYAKKGYYEYDDISFNELFSSYFPSLSSTICKEENIKPLHKKCHTNLYNLFQCPMIITLENLQNIGDDIDEYCYRENENLYYIDEIGGKRKSIEELLSEGRYTYGMPEMKELLQKYNKNFKDYKLTKKLDYSDFETEKEFREENLLQINHYKNTSLIQSLPIPPVDIDLIYTSAIETMTGEFLKKENLLEKGVDIISGGDGTVSTWSALLVGLKWIYDKKKNNLKQKIRLVEYCSRLNKDFPYKEYSNFIALGCKCINEQKNSYKDNFDNCDHQKMLLDPSLLSYINKIIYNKKENQINEDRKRAAKEVLIEKNYENICNFQLLKYSNTTDKAVVIGLSLELKILIGIIISFFVIWVFCAFCCSYFNCCQKIYTNICCCCCNFCNNCITCYQCIFCEIIKYIISKIWAFCFPGRITSNNIDRTFNPQSNSERRLTGTSDQDNPQGTGDQANNQGAGDQTNPQGIGEQTNHQGAGDQTNPQGVEVKTNQQGTGEQTNPQGTGEQTNPQGEGDQTNPQGTGEQTNPQGIEVKPNQQGTSG